MNMSESLTSELWLKIDQLHLKYLQSEDNPLKLDIRKKLEGLVADYLSIVPQQRKFVSAATGDIISNSAKWKPDFSLVKAAQAFRAIEQYAANLINQPWRQEFWNIRQYSGFYKHSVETALFGAEKMFMDMGYSPSPGQAQVLSLAQPRVGEHPVNIDMVTSVARDCVLACVECHLLAEVHNTVSAQFPTVLEEVIDFRRDHIGSIDVCTRELVYRKNQLRFQFPSPMTNPQYGIQNFAYPAPPQPVPAPVSNYQPQQTNGYTPAAFPATGPVYGYSEFPLGAAPAPVVGQCYGPPPPGLNGQHVAMERLSAGHRSHHSPAGSSSTCTLRQIPTTILELAGSGGGGSGGHEPVAPQRRDRGERERERDRDREGGARPREHKENGKSNSRSRKSGVEQDFDSWDYVYKHLEQTGYTKDQAERPDVLESSQSQSDEELRRNIQGLRLRDTRNGDSGHREHGGHRNGDSGHGGHRNNGQRSRHNGSNGGGRHQDHDVREHHHHQSHNRYSRVETSESEQEQDHSRYSSALSEDTVQPQRQPRGGGQRPQSGGRGGGAELWECSTCTYHNKQGSNICEMCSKSRDFQPVAETRSVEPARAQERASVSCRKMSQSDGTACTKCTLVNPAGNKLCDACGATLPKCF